VLAASFLEPASVAVLTALLLPWTGRSSRGGPTRRYRGVGGSYENGLAAAPSPSGSGDEGGGGGGFRRGSVVGIAGGGGGGGVGFRRGSVVGGARDGAGDPAAQDPARSSTSSGARIPAPPEWGSAHIVLERVPEDYHLQPFKKMFPFMLSSSASIVVGVLRSKHIHGAPADYVIIAPEPDMSLYAYCESADGKTRLPGDHLYVLAR
jgi:hypothetical protein